jgi:hypothetical protein
VIGDMISQHIIEQRPFGPGVWSDEAHAQGVEERNEEGHVWIRTARLAFYGVRINSLFPFFCLDPSLRMRFAGHCRLTCRMVDY